MYTVDEFTEKTKLILESDGSDVSVVSAELSDLTENYQKVMAKISENDEQIAKQIEQIGKLREANVDLYLRLSKGETDKTKEQAKEDEKTIPVITDLFDENGNLK